MIMNIQPVTVKKCASQFSEKEDLEEDNKGIIKKITPLKKN